MITSLSLFKLYLKLQFETGVFLSFFCIPAPYVSGAESKTRLESKNTVNKVFIPFHVWWCFRPAGIPPHPGPGPGPIPGPGHAYAHAHAHWLGAYQAELRRLANAEQTAGLQPAEDSFTCTTKGANTEAPPFDRVTVHAHPITPNNSMGLHMYGMHTFPQVLGGEELVSRDHLAQMCGTKIKQEAHEWRTSGAPPADANIHSGPQRTRSEPQRCWETMPPPVLFDISFSCSTFSCRVQNTSRIHD